MWWSLAFAGPIDVLDAAVKPSASAHVGSFRYFGHGPTPNASTDYPLAVTVVDVPDGMLVHWRSKDWQETVLLGATSWTLEKGIWESVAPAEVDALALKYLSPRPDKLLAWMARHPARLHVHDDTLLWATPAGLATLTLENGSPAALRLPHAHPVFGDAEHLVTWKEEHTTVAMTEANTRWSVVLDAAGEAPQPEVPPRPPALELRSEDLSDDTAWFAFPTIESRVVVTTHGTRGVVLDVPMDSAHGTALHTAVAKRFPEVVDWTVVISHHHPHYTGGLRPWTLAGADVLAHAAIADWLTQQLTVKRTLDPADLPTPDPRLTAIQKRHKLLGGRVVVHPIDDASGHTEAFLVTHLRDLDLLYVADLGSMREGAEQARVRGTWPDLFTKTPPQQVISGFPVSGTIPVWSFDQIAR